jgi:hypothetical protein
MEMDMTIKRGGEALAMGHHQEATAGAGNEIARQFQNVVGGIFVEIAGGFICE